MGLQLRCWRKNLEPLRSYAELAYWLGKLVRICDVATCSTALDSSARAVVPGFHSLVHHRHGKPLLD